ncbi:hypothetical protein ACXR0O_14430 [Verrucomicrobiota bacterium sgz303538]
MIRHSLRARRLSLCATAAGLFIVGLSVAPVTADAAPVGGRVSPDHGRSNSFLGNIVSGGARWATRSSWENVFRGGVPSFFGAEFVSFSPYSSGISPVVISQDDAGSQPSFGGSGVTVRGVQLQGNLSSGAVVKLGGGTLQIGSSGSPSNSPVSIANSGSLTVSQDTTPASGTVINVTGGGVNDIQSQPGKTADVVAAVPPPPPPAPPLPPRPPGPPVVSR